MHDLQHSIAAPSKSLAVWLRRYLVINLKRKKMVFAERLGEVLQLVVR